MHRFVSAQRPRYSAGGLAPGLACRLIRSLLCLEVVHQLLPPAKSRPAVSDDDGGCACGKGKRPRRVAGDPFHGEFGQFILSWPVGECPAERNLAAFVMSQFDELLLVFTGP